MKSTVIDLSVNPLEFINNDDDTESTYSCLVDLSVNPLDFIDNDTEDSSAKYIYEDFEEFNAPLSKGTSDQRGFLFMIDDVDMEKFRICCSVLSSVNEKNMPREKTMERGISLPCKRSTTTPLPEKRLQKSYSLPPHVHPKLPDYDVIHATFTALKGQNLLKRNQLISTPC